MNHVFPQSYPEICYTTATDRNAKMEPFYPLSLLLSLSHCSARFVVSLEMWCYEQSLKKQQRLCNKVHPVTEIPKPLTSLQWHHVSHKFQHPKTMEHTDLKLHCMTIVPEDAPKNKFQLHGNLRIGLQMLCDAVSHCTVKSVGKVESIATVCKYRNISLCFSLISTGIITNTW